MGNRKVENCEERLARGAFAVVGLGRAGIPQCGVVAFEIVVGLRVVGAVISRFAQVGDVGLERGWDRVAAAHVLGSLADRMGAVQQGRAGDRADRGIRIGMGEAQPFGGQRVEPWRAGLAPAVAAQPVGRVVLGRDPQDVGPVGGGCGVRQRERQQRDEQEHGLHDWLEPPMADRLSASPRCEPPAAMPTTGVICRDPALRVLACRVPTMTGWPHSASPPHALDPWRRQAGP